MKPKKSLGQNFLRDKTVLSTIIEVSNLTREDNVIEIGPGEGVLTDEMLKKTGKLIVIEKDDSLAARLDLRLRGNNRITIINEDILEINLPEILEKNNFKNYKLIANIPYYITSPIIRLFLETTYQPTEIILMVQREVAERICASPGQMSILASSVQYYASSEIISFVDKNSFWPVPEVDSAIIRITPFIEKPTQKEAISFFRIVTAGFSAKRKTLSNNLSSSFHLDKKTVEEKIRLTGLAPTQRAQELTIENWKKLAEIFNV